MTWLRPFWAYYGGKWRDALSYPPPRFRTIVEPCAGAAGYSLRYPARDIVLFESYPVLAEVWRFLIGANASEVLRIPCVESTDDLPSWVCDGARWLVGFCLNNGTTSPRRTLSSGLRKLQAMGRKLAGWTEARRALVASQLDAIRHWKIFEGDYSQAPDIEATWFIDAPYQGQAGEHYVHGSDRIDYHHLGRFCRSRRGQPIVCEGSGADWLPFRPHGLSKAGPGKAPSREVVWLGEGMEMAA